MLCLEYGQTPPWPEEAGLAARSVRRATHAGAAAWPSSPPRTTSSLVPRARHTPSGALLATTSGLLACSPGFPRRVTSLHPLRSQDRPPSWKSQSRDTPLPATSSSPQPLSLLLDPRRAFPSTAAGPEPLLACAYVYTRIFPSSPPRSSPPALRPSSLPCLSRSRPSTKSLRLSASIAIAISIWYRHLHLHLTCGALSSRVAEPVYIRHEREHPTPRWPEQPRQGDPITSLMFRFVWPSSRTER
ncbi:hypothetical protein L226DRAFT_371964 [Lentinus tigrinus ALCF2SS1-7]|uniref:uncharacterized protein n=1 Tax=Lentinus tigrinus ALCF2SS1-7 TaxID=1328758 RepID=UPI0011663808|nr:hypothetical protein L226DRAFT_371964 [Lentinus tigrinus ALCF2SS1-7]